MVASPTVPTDLHVPSYRHHKPSGQAVVTLGYRDFYLGPYGSADSKAEYQRRIGEWLARGRTLPDPTGNGPSINEVILAYLHFADGYYRDASGSPTREVETMKLVFRPLKALYGHTPAKEFGPKSLMAVRQEMIKAGLARRTINQRVGYIKRLFAWASSEELVPSPTYHGLLCVRSLPPCRSGVRESQPVGPVPETHVDAIVAYLPPVLQTMLALQRLTGMRSGELVRLKACEIDMSQPIWLYRPSQHKTKYLQRTRVITLGPKCQQLITPLLTLRPTDYLFAPCVAEAQRDQIMRAARQSKVQPSQKCRRKNDPEKTAGESYDAKSYYRALKYAMLAAQRAGKLSKEHFWHPHQLRHNAAQRIAREVSAEAARAFLGHAKIDMTAHYSGLDEVLATTVAKKLA